MASILPYQTKIRNILFIIFRQKLFIAERLHALFYSFPMPNKADIVRLFFDKLTSQVI